MNDDAPYPFPNRSPVKSSTSILVCVPGKVACQVCGCRDRQREGCTCHCHDVVSKG